MSNLIGSDLLRNLSAYHINGGLCQEALRIGFLSPPYELVYVAVTIREMQESGCGSRWWPFEMLTWF
jgi:hypothetical protein